MKKNDITGNKYGKLTVLCENGRKGKNILWRCVCDCGKEIDAISYNLKNGHTKSCGCYAKEVNSIVKSTHKQSKTRLYKIWRGIKTRCLNSKENGFKNYGGRGIEIYKEWKNSFKTFMEWANSNGYNETLSIDRIDVNGNYEPLNCRWITLKEQANNKRNNRLITFGDKTLSLSQWADETGISSSTISSRIDCYGWSVDKALNTPIRRKIPIEIISCACGCGETFNKYSKYGRIRKYVLGHNRQSNRQGLLE